MARHATLVAEPHQLDRGLDDELVVLDLDDLEELAADGRHRAEDRPAPFDAFATLPFGLGTVPRRIRPERATRTPLWLLALAALAMVAALAGNPSSHGAGPGSGPALLDSPTGASVALVAYDRVVTVDVDRHTSHVVRLAGLRDGDATSTAPAGRMFVAVIDGHAWAISRLLDRPAADLGPADAAFGTATASTADPAPVWLARHRGGAWEVTRVDPAAGRVEWRGLTAPGATIIGASRDALVVDDGHGTAEILGTGRRIAVPVRGTPLAAGPGVIATRVCTRRACSLELVSLADGRARRIATSLSPTVRLGPTAFAPGNDSIASVTDGPGGASTRVLVVRDRATRVVDTGQPATALAWSGDWLFVLRSDGQLDAIGGVGPAQLVDTDGLPAGALVGLPAS